MIEREMQELLWLYPERFLNEPLKQIAWEPPSAVGRADLVFEDRHERLLVIEVKHGKLPRGAIDQLLDYFGMMKQRFPDKAVELMVVANVIPAERRLTCESRDIECREISERMFRDVAAEFGYIFASEVNAQAALEAPTNTSRPRDTGTHKGDGRTSLFAVMGASTRTLIIESIIAGVFVLFAVLGFKGNYWLVVAALIGHGVFDFVRHFFIDNPGVPQWWPGFCLASDVVFGAWLALLIRQRQVVRGSTT